jgi:hypothetical protein
MVNRQDTHVVQRDEPVDDAIRSVDDLTNQRILEFRNGATRFGEEAQAVDRSDEPRNDDVGVVRRVLSNVDVNCSEVGLRLFRLVDGLHARKGFLTSSCDTSSPESD